MSWSGWISRHKRDTREEVQEKLDLFIEYLVRDEISDQNDPYHTSCGNFPEIKATRDKLTSIWRRWEYSPGNREKHLRKFVEETFCRVPERVRQLAKKRGITPLIGVLYGYERLCCTSNHENAVEYAMQHGCGDTEQPAPQPDNHTTSSDAGTRTNDIDEELPTDKDSGVTCFFPETSFPRSSRLQGPERVETPSCTWSFNLSKPGTSSTPNQPPALTDDDTNMRYERASTGGY